MNNLLSKTVRCVSNVRFKFGIKLKLFVQIRVCLQSSLLVVSEFKQIDSFTSPEIIKKPKDSYDFRGNRSLLTCINSFNIKSDIWSRSLIGNVTELDPDFLLEWSFGELQHSHHPQLHKNDYQ